MVSRGERCCRVVRVALGMTLSVGVASEARSAELPDGHDTALPCRPTISCTAVITPPGTLEVEVGGIASKLAGGSRSLAFPFLLKQSVAKFLQLQLGSNGYTIATSSPTAATARYLDNVFLGPKFHLVDQSKWVP